MVVCVDGLFVDGCGCCFLVGEGCVVFWRKKGVDIRFVFWFVLGYLWFRICSVC